MKKHLFTCFLASLCLYGSTLPAQVADSPGADFPHRSVTEVSFRTGDTHRGGGTRSDTMPERIDLVSYSGAQGQEGESSSASVGEAAPAVIYVETLSLEPMDSLEFRLWDPYLNERGFPKPEVAYVQLSPGNLFEGSRGAQVGQWKSPPLAGYSRVTIRNNRFIYLDRFLVQPGDSVRIRLDFQTANVLFSGPSEDKFLIQYELALALENERYHQSPVMFTSKPDFWGYSEEDSLLIARVKSTKSSITRSMEYISPGESALTYLQKAFDRDISAHPAFGIINRYRGKLPLEFLNVLEADVQGKLLYDQIADFLYLRGGKDSEEAYRKLFEEQILENTPLVPDGAGLSAYYPDFLYHRLVIISNLENIPLAELLPSVPASVRDQVDAKYIVKNYRRFSDSNQQFENALARMKTPWVRKLVSALYHAQRIGEPLVEIPLMTVEGKPYILKQEPGKVRFIHFWLTGCEASSRQYQNLLAPVIDFYRNDPEVEFVFIASSRSEERWLEELRSGDYADGSSLNLNAPGTSHPFLAHYNIHAYPTRMVVGMDGTVASLGNIPRSPEGLIEYIESLKKENLLTP
ncbi:hypothetical protein SAMN04489724_0683 [Algoriphagus locisalis]|uniref:Thioredoxin domain-containing protein n=1 Tax=Algoriphagus locisalis TaxID=305507 RepID=A0A1I6XW76_9BACT|nr:thioredoxin-like domain-containing protein [Algoriphagus locisalis]SFT42171.1 hypothetical protein SAMN04489724_0683 [Algoriphagus locisalis]